MWSQGWFSDAQPSCFPCHHEAILIFGLLPENCQAGKRDHSLGLDRLGLSQLPHPDYVTLRDKPAHLSSLSFLVYKKRVITGPLFPRILVSSNDVHMNMCHAAHCLADTDKGSYSDCLVLSTPLVSECSQDRASPSVKSWPWKMVAHACHGQGLVFLTTSGLQLRGHLDACRGT